MSDFLDKVNIVPIITGHFRTLYNDRTRKISASDLILFLGSPLIAVAITVVFDVKLGTTSGLLAATAALAAFLFALLILVLQMAAQVATSSETGGVSERNRRRVKYLREIAVNVAYSVVLCIFATILLAIGELTLPVVANESARKAPPHQPLWYSAPTFYLLTHLVLTLLMVVKRTFSMTESELDNASVSPEREGPS